MAASGFAVRKQPCTATFFSRAAAEGGTHLKTLIESMVVMLLVGLVVAVGVAGVAGAAMWLLTAAAYDRVVSRGCGIGYWRWLGDRWHRMCMAAEEGRELPPAVRQRTFVKLEHQAGRLARQIETDRLRSGVFVAWTVRQDERRLGELRKGLAAEREALYGPLGPPEPYHRVADADREQAVAALREAHDEGRLDWAEFEQRVGRAYAARTYEELDGLVSDLRTESATSSRQRRQLRVSHADRERALRALHAATGEGRLSAAEFEERAERAYGAKTEADLERVLDDLPDSYALRGARL